MALKAVLIDDETGEVLGDITDEVFGDEDEGDEYIDLEPGYNDLPRRGERVAESGGSKIDPTYRDTDGRYDKEDDDQDAEFDGEHDVETFNREKGRSTEKQKKPRKASYAKSRYADDDATVIDRDGSRIEKLTRIQYDTVDEGLVKQKVQKKPTINKAKPKKVKKTYSAEKDIKKKNYLETIEERHHRLALAASGGVGTAAYKSHRKMLAGIDEAFKTRDRNLAFIRAQYKQDVAEGYAYNDPNSNVSKLNLVRKIQKARRLEEHRRLVTLAKFGDKEAAGKLALKALAEKVTNQVLDKVISEMRVEHELKVIEEGRKKVELKNAAEEVAAFLNMLEDTGQKFFK